MKFEMATLKQKYAEYQQKESRALKKWAFVIGTFGLGGLYLWANTKIINEGEIGLRRTGRGEMVLLPPGRHSNFPWESYPVPVQSLSKKTIDLGPFKIINVETGYVAKTYNQGKLEVLEEGQHLLTDASHVFNGFVPVKQETKKLHAVTAYTSDNVGLTLQADVRYQIANPDAAIRQIDDIETSITEIAEISISQIVSHHTLTDFAPATARVGQNQQSEENGLSKVIHELTAKITEQLRQLGIDLLSIGITSWSINDKDLAHELAQGAVIQSQTQSKMLSVQQAAQIKAIETDAAAKAIVTIANSEAQAKEINAQGEANAIERKGNAIKALADRFANDPVAQTIYGRSQQIELVGHAKSPYLFFTPEGCGNSGNSPIMTLPLEHRNSLQHGN